MELSEQSLKEFSLTFQDARLFYPKILTSGSSVAQFLQHKTLGEDS